MRDHFAFESFCPARAAGVGRYFGHALLCCLAAASMYYLFAYGRAIAWRWEASERSFSVRWFEEISVWLYRDRDAAGHPSSPYKLSRSLSEIDPLDGPNWEIRIPGWIPAVGALGILAATGISFLGMGGRDEG
jgi:hypothetical protein